MSSVGNILLEKEILLESGTNEVEILVFRVGGFSLGVNVAKVREVLPAQKITHLPQAHESIVGCFTLREHVVPCVSLHHHLGEPVACDVDETTIILTEFNQYQTAFVVDSVERIHRISWNDVLAAPSIVNSVGTPVTAVTNIDNRLILMLDFEMIADQVSGQTLRTGIIENPHNLPREEFRILLADDSATVRQAAMEALQSSGYTNLTVFENGEQTWEWLQNKIRETGDVSQFADLLVSDIEMPRIDGLHLTKNIKEHPQLRQLFVLLYSSIITADNRKKGDAVHADGMIAKPELARIVEMADEMLLQKRDLPQTSPSIKSHSDDQLDTHSEHSKLGTAAETMKPTKSVADNRLWITFRNELRERVDQLGKLCQSAEDGQPTEQFVNDVFRVLHSIKSASMVVPVDEITNLTHVAETSIDLVRQKISNWPANEMNAYLDWLRELANPENDEHELQAVLANAGRLEKEIDATLIG